MSYSTLHQVLLKKILSNFDLHLFFFLQLKAPSRDTFNRKIDITSLTKGGISHPDVCKQKHSRIDTETGFGQLKKPCTQIGLLYADLIYLQISG